jgi:arylsulfatase A
MKKNMTRRELLRKSVIVGSTALAGCMFGLSACTREDTPQSSSPAIKTISDLLKKTNPDAPRPNIVIINCDDLGYGDIGCYGSKAIRTPAIDRLAKEGIRFTDFYASNALCSPSRAGLLTGRYPQRCGITWPLWAKDDSLGRRLIKRAGHLMGGLGVTDMGGESLREGLHHQEITIAEALKVAGYRTGMVGKWHLGDFSKQPQYNPLQHGFDEFFGVPHSNDMWPCALYRNETELESDIGLNQGRLTGLYTEEATAFIEKSRKEPFFLYFAHTFPHQPLFASERFKGRSSGGLYGDVVEEVDWSVNEVLRCLKRNGFDRKTIIFFTSDNGPWFEGSPGSLRGRKGQSYEGGFRVPLIVKWPGHIKPGSICQEPAMNIDILPTILHLAGVSLPVDRIIDGRNILGLLTGKEKKSPHEALFFYHHDELEGVRAGKWKYFRNIHHYVYPLPIDKETYPLGRMGRGRLGRWPLLHNMELDPGENYNLIDTYPEIGEKMLKILKNWEKKMARNQGGWIR